MIRELRIYDCAPGRRPALVRRFEDHTLALFLRHGFRPGSFLLSTEDADRLIYFLDWEDMAERDAKFPRFRADPDWIAARDASERDGPVTLRVTSSFFAPIDLPTHR
jgi:hypothetical protein